MRPCGQAPQQYRAEEHTLDADSVDQAALQDKADGVAHLKPKVDVGVIHRRPAHLFGQNRLHHTQGGAVDVVQRGGEKDQREHAPAGFTDRHGAANPVADAAMRCALGRGATYSLRRDHDYLPVHDKAGLHASGVGKQSVRSINASMSGYPFLELLCGVLERLSPVVRGRWWRVSKKSSIRDRP